MDDLSPGYNLPDPWSARLALLDWLYDNGGRNPGTFIELGPLFDNLDADDGGRDEQQAVAARLRDLESRGWVRLQETLGWGGWSGQLTQDGIDFVGEVRRQRGDTVGRRRAARDAVLRWLYDRKAAGQANPVMNAGGLGGYASYYGHAFTEQELNDAAGWLKEKGYLRGTGSWNGGIPRPGITAEGEQIVESGRPVHDVTPSTAAADIPALAINVTGSSGVNIAAYSPGAQQSMTLTQDQRHQVLQVAEALDQMRGQALGLNPRDAEVAGEVVAHLRELVDEPDPDRSHLRAALDQAAEVALSGTATAVGGALVALVQQATQALGLG